MAFFKKIKSLLFHHIIDLIFPERCPGCKRHAKIKKYCFCSDCLNHITPAASSDKKIFSLAVYEEPIKQAIYEMKYQKRKWIAREFAKWMNDFLKNHPEIEFDLIIPVPLHPVKEFQRSFNQSWLMAYYLGKMQKKPACYDGLIKIKNNRSQTDLKPEERKKNVENVYRTKRIALIKGKKILVIDDVYTTGATAEEVYKTLKKAGAKSVIILTIAKA